VSLKNLCSRKWTFTLSPNECWKQHSIPSPCISHNNFCSITQPIGDGCYPPSWLSLLLKEMWAFTTHKGDLRFYTIPCRYSRFHHMWRKSSITHLFVVICHQFGFHHLGRKCLSMHLLGVICSTFTIHDRNVQPHYCLTSFVSNFQPPPKKCLYTLLFGISCH
jgi:hypothetical protein